VALLTFASLSANANVNPPACSALKDLESKHRTWRADFHRFQRTSANVLSADEQSFVQRRSLKIVIDRLRDIQSLSGHESNNRGLINDATRFLAAYDRNEITNTSASRLMTSALPKFEDAIDDALFKAQVDSPDCVILPFTSGATTSSPAGESTR
jgi:hypothetical protein